MSSRVSAHYDVAISRIRHRINAAMTTASTASIVTLNSHVWQV
jgi:hypothetical protein